MTTGDIKGSLRRVQMEVRLLRYPHEVDYEGLLTGDAKALLPLLHHTFTEYSLPVAECLAEWGVELAAKSDLRFVEAVYRVLRDRFEVRPVLTKAQFLQLGFAERKMQMLCDIGQAVRTKHKELTQLAHKGLVVAGAGNGNVPRPLVQRHCGPHGEAARGSCPTPRQGVLPEAEVLLELPSHAPQSSPEGKKDDTNATNHQLLQEMSELRATVLQLQAQYAKTCANVAALSFAMQGSILVDRSEWENLASRVTLLENQAVLLLAGPRGTSRGDASRGDASRGSASSSGDAPGTARVSKLFSAGLEDRGSPVPPGAGPVSVLVEPSTSLCPVEGLVPTQGSGEQRDPLRKSNDQILSMSLEKAKPQVERLERMLEETRMMLKSGTFGV
ncbi:centrosomal protein of 44 kDa isoform X2 [Lethenteron reissneri]|uniref:centrosomal protein of 44 kDa isoform X2 n=1 Tax=Lethenteron reissneri TaxID=7753 RepID=UPI002AB7E3BD|nr:centrosomal protein of 44 kDa isoform X2 [Lethenteron reissneri]